MRRRASSAVVGLCLFIVSMLLTMPASAQAAAQVRFVNAAAGAGAVDASVDGRSVATKLAFGVATQHLPVEAGSHAIAVDGVRGKLSFADGRRYTVVAVGDGIERLIKLPDGRANAGQARLRVVHAAAEVANVDIRLDGDPVAEAIELGEEATYQTVEPGQYGVSATRPDGEGGALATRDQVALAAGTATTIVLLGSAGEPLSLQVLDDAAFTPGAAPATGLGGLARPVELAGSLADRAPWALAAIALILALGLLARALGAAARMAPAGRRASLTFAGVTAGALAFATAPVGTRADDARYAETKLDLVPVETFTPARELPSNPVPLRPVTSTAGHAGITPPRLESLKGGLRPGRPVRISIPAAGVDAAIESVHADRTGVQVPDPGTAGWIDAGPRPGERGRAVVIGHRDSEDGPGLFARVPNVPPGTAIEVTDETGHVRRYNVIGGSDVEKESFPSDEVYGASPEPVLVLITCGGPWQTGSGYRDNVLVYARAS